ncbi:Cthe_2314 family HEPN domain-containing protein [Paenibacillus piri]|uniref:Cthe_2314 family HEPN domain-containing protein n=1 Tax=Paenibacillus piri TaxID=2547395 RepID=UPI0014043098|nr:Cthe_2314 family HEPN domain-containing protein [Paenibacillus piri]
MLRMMFGEPRRKDEGLLAKANQTIRGYLQMLESVPELERNLQERRYIVWSRGMLRALDELEQSEYAAVRFGKKVSKLYVDEMQEDELEDYHRHLYFYRNAIVRVFAILDKLGHFMNERFRLRTEEIKARYSYFTVLRNMHDNHLYVQLEERLFGLKVKYKAPVERLRNERNMEIHTINADLLDDLLRAAETKQTPDQRIKTEEIGEHLKDLALGSTMTFTAAEIIFTYIYALSKSSGQYPSSS